FFFTLSPPPTPTLFPYTTLFRSLPPPKSGPYISSVELSTPFLQMIEYSSRQSNYNAQQAALDYHRFGKEIVRVVVEIRLTQSYGDRKSTRLNSSHLVISYAVFCL